MGTPAPKDDVVGPTIPPGRRRRVGAPLLALAVGAVAGYVLVGFPGNGFPGRAGIRELRHVEEAINVAYQACGVDERASIDWFWGQVDVPSTNGVVGDMPMDVDLTRDELGHATGSMNYFRLVCPQTPIR